MKPPEGLEEPPTPGLNLHSAAIFEADIPQKTSGSNSVPADGGSTLTGDAEAKEQ